MARIRDSFGGEMSAGKIGGISGQEMDLREMGVSNKDMDYVNLDEVTKATIFGRYNIPLPLITASRQTLDNYATAILALYDDAVLPTVDILFEGLSDFILPRFGRDPRRERITYDPEAILPLRQRRLAELRELVELKVMTLNEVRERLSNLDGLPGGDVVLIPGTMVPGAGEGVDLVADAQVEDLGGNQPEPELAPESENDDA